jgi:hypothetical protein
MYILYIILLELKEDLIATQYSTAKNIRELFANVRSRIIMGVVVQIRNIICTIVFQFKNFKQERFSQTSTSPPCLRSITIIDFQRFWKFTS